MESHSEIPVTPQEAIPEKPSLRIECELLDTYGRLVEKKEFTSSDLGELSFMVKDFDGFIHTAKGDFAFQGPITEARQVIKDAELFALKSLELETKSAAFAEVESHFAHLGARFRSHDETEGYGEALRKMEGLAREVRILKTDIKALEEKLGKYKL